MNLLDKVYAQSNLDTLAAPTFPFTPPFEEQPPATTTDGAKISLNTSKATLKVGEKTTVTIRVESDDIEINTYKIVISYDPTKLGVIDKDAQTSGTQISFTDTYFTDNANLASEQIGTIEIAATTPSSAVTVNRNVADIEFEGRATGTVTLEIMDEHSSLTGTNNTNIPASTVPLVITITGDTTTPTIIPTPGLPKSGILDESPVLTGIVGILLVMTGIMLAIRYRKVGK
ncbi:hypothetical protein JW796_02455 [Candidatus Dojkabacteria bacterium]|nr:hypothetical protein [Candidatus Dojkabacteria bacterium]